MKDYPVDRFMSVTVWPMDMATRVPSKPLKLLLILLYLPWFVMLLPITFVLLLVSLVWATWDSVNDPS